MYLFDFRTDPGFADKFDRRDEEVKIIIPFRGIEFVE